jgi:hypothetical protein
LSDSNFPNLAELLQRLEKAARVSAGDSRAEKFTKWSKSPSQTEIDKCERAARMVRQAVDADPKLSAMDISVYAKGSFANRTNIPSDSDVDVAVVASRYYFNDYPAGKGSSDFGMETVEYTFEQFRADVYQAVINKFGAGQVTAGKKSIKVHSNTSRVDADVVPHFVHRRYLDAGGYIEGVSLRDTSGNITKNWPDQDYRNGVAKNERTGKKYKALVRTLKSIKSEMKSAGIASADHAPSYLIACLAWNVPDYIYEMDDFEPVVMDAINFLIDKTADYENVKEWGEVNELKYLFRSTQPWSRGKVHEFLKDAKAFVEAL